MSFLVAPPMFGGRGTSLINEIKNLGLTTNLRVCLDAGDLNSYDGTSQTWKDLSGGGYDFYRGTSSSSESSDPTFNGTAGKLSSGEYFSYDGGDYFAIAGSIPAWVNALHHDNATVTIVEWVYANAISSSQIFGEISTVSATHGGVTFGNSTGLSLAFVAASDTANLLEVDSTVQANNNAWNLIGVSLTEAIGALAFICNGVTEDHTGATYASPDTGNAGSFFIGHDYVPETEHSGNRIAALAIWDRALSDAELLSIYKATKARFGF